MAAPRQSKSAGVSACEEPERSQAAAGLAHFLCTRGQERLRGVNQQGVLITTINGQPVAAHPMARFLMDAGFHPGPLGMHLRRIPLSLAQPARAQREVQ
jgi:ATP-dependent Lhr-like helicase